MKLKLIVAPLALSVGLTATACTDLLIEEPEGFTTTDTFYKTGADLNSATIAIYSALRGLQGFGNWPNLELASDQARADNREPNATTRSGDHLNWDASTGQTGGYWNTFYSVITRANLVLDNGPGIATPNQSMKTYNLAEAKFLRGYAYFWLTKLYDDVPLLLSGAEQANPSPTRTPVEEIHQAVIADLTDAEADLPAKWAANDGFNLPTQGRITKGAAQMALADLYLWRSSFLMKNEWQLASDWAKKVIDSGVWSLNDDYIKTFLPANKGNPEMIFVITNTGKEGRTSSPWQLFYYPRDWGIDQWGGWGLIHPTNWFDSSYAAGDYRKDAGYIKGGCSGGGMCVQTFADGPMPWKYRKSDNGANWPLGDVDAPLYRFAEALLIYAEAQNELGNTAEAITYLNKVRARARKGTGAENRSQPADYSGPTDQLSVRDAIYMERAWELAFEAKRWFDLVRRDSREPGYWLTSLDRHDPNAKSVIPVISAHKKRFPIPQTQINANPSLTQNPGY
jgi:starch-binding outer membrane protein, SusD/RagB family